MEGDERSELALDDATRVVAVTAAPKPAGGSLATGETGGTSTRLPAATLHHKSQPPDDVEMPAPRR